MLNIEYINDVSNIKFVTRPNFKALGERLKADMTKGN